jgi:hypothetical protein
LVEAAAVEQVVMRKVVAAQEVALLQERVPEVAAV